MSWDYEDGMEFDAKTGELKNIVIYEYEGDAAIFRRRCNCGRMLKAMETAYCSEYGVRAKGSCTRCGTVDLNFICWGSDAQ